MATSEESLSILIMVLPSCGTMMRTAWGSTIWVTICRDGSSLWLLPCYRLCPSAWEGDGMAEMPRSLPAFEARFPDEAACARWLLEKRWPDGFRCPACGHAKAWELARERLTLQCAACERQVSVTAGTALHGSHLPLRTWFLAAWLVAAHRNGMSARQLWR